MANKGSGIDGVDTELIEEFLRYNEKYLSSQIQKGLLSPKIISVIKGMSSPG